MSEIKYPELPDISKAKPKYKDGDILNHPSGAVYKRIDGIWVCIRTPE